VVVLVVGVVGTWMVWSLLSSFVNWQVCYARLVTNHEPSNQHHPCLVHLPIDPKACLLRS